MLKFLKIILMICCGMVLACDTSNTKPLHISFNIDSTAIVIANIESAGVFHLKKSIKVDSSYQKLVSVLQVPTDTDTSGVEIVWPGKLDMIGDSLLFIPDQPFLRGKDYLVETMINTTFASSKDVLKAKVGHYVKAQKQLLNR